MSLPQTSPVPVQTQTDTDRPSRHPSLYVSFSADGRMVLENGVPSGRLESSRELMDVLALCDGSRTLTGIAEQLPWSEPSPEARLVLVRVLLERLRHHGLVLDSNGCAPAQPNYGYARPEIHRTMLLDGVRTESFRAAIRDVVKPGHVVVDMGTGTGVLAMFAAQAGAAEVHGIECSAIADPARRVLDINGFRSIQLHQCDAETLELPVKADVIVSEWLGYFVYADGMYPAFASLRDRILKPGGAAIPSSVEVLLAPFEDRDSRGHTYWNGKPYGFDFGPILEEEYRFSQIRFVNPDALLAPSQVVDRIDCLVAGPKDLCVERRASWRLDRKGTLNAMCGSFRARLSPEVVLDTAPGAPETHWQQHVFAIRPIEVQSGDRLDLTFRTTEAPYDVRLVRIELEGRVISPGGEERGRFIHDYDQ